MSKENDMKRLSNALSDLFFDLTRAGACINVFLSIFGLLHSVQECTCRESGRMSQIESSQLDRSSGTLFVRVHLAGCRARSSQVVGQEKAHRKQ